MNLLFSIHGMEAGTDGIKIDACQIVGLKPKKRKKKKKKHKRTYKLCNHHFWPIFSQD